MFISSSVARERLTSSKNRLADSFKDRQLPSGDRDDLDKPEEELVPDASPDVDGKDFLKRDHADADHDDLQEKLDAPSPLTSLASNTPSLSDMKAILAAHDQEVIDFSKLDAIIDGSYEDREGRGHGSRKFRMDTEAQTAIGEVATLTTQQTAADLFGISQAQVHAYDNAGSSSNHVARGEHKADLKARLDSFKELIAAKAAIRLHETLDLLDGAKLRTIKKATNLSRVGKDLATIMRNVEERLDRGGQESVVFHVFTPPMKKADDYDVVQATVVRPSDGGEDLPKI
jgi:hypothetical protein